MDTALQRATLPYWNTPDSDTVIISHPFWSLQIPPDLVGNPGIKYCVTDIIMRDVERLTDKTPTSYG